MVVTVVSISYIFVHDLYVLVDAYSSQIGVQRSLAFIHVLIWLPYFNKVLYFGVRSNNYLFPIENYISDGMICDM